MQGDGKKGSAFYSARDLDLGGGVKFEKSSCKAVPRNPDLDGSTRWADHVAGLLLGCVVCMAESVLLLAHIRRSCLLPRCTRRSAPAPADNIHKIITLATAIVHPCLPYAIYRPLFLIIPAGMNKAYDTSASALELVQSIHDPHSGQAKPNYAQI